MHITSPETLEHAIVPTDPDARARFLAAREHKLYESALAGRAQAFRRAVLDRDYDRASELFTAEVGGTTRTRLLQELEGDEPVAFCRHVSPQVRNEFLTVHPNRAWFERDALVSTDDLPRFIMLRRAPMDDGFAMIASTDRRDITASVANHLADAGVPVNKIKGDLERGAPTHRYPGWHPSDQLLRASNKNDGGLPADSESETAFLARLEVDPELVRMIREGRLLVDTHTRRGRVADHQALVDCRART